jgi:hypothetical protein
MSFDINDIIAAVGIQTKNAAETAARITGNSQMAESISQQQALNAATAGENDAIVIEQKGKAELEAQRNSRKFAVAIGSDIGASTDVLTSLGMQYTQATAESIQAADRVKQKQSVGLMDNPIEYIMNQITIGDDINYANAAQEKVTAISTAMAGINQATQSTAATQNAIKETVTAATIKAAADNVKLKADAEAAKWNLEALKYNTTNLLELQKLTETQLNNQFQLKGAMNAERQMEIAAGNLALARESHRVAMEEKLERINAKKAEKAEQDELVTTINKGLAIQGLNPIDGTKAITILTKLGGPMKEILMAAYNSGSIQQANGVSVIAETPGQAAATLMRSGSQLGKSAAPAMGPVVDLIKSTLQETANDPKLQGAKEHEIIKAANGNIKAITAQMSKNIKVGDNTNIYSPPTLPSIVEAVPTVTQSPFFQKVLAVQVTNGLNEFDPNKLLSLGASAVASGTVTVEEVADGISKLAKGAAATNNATKDYMRVGVPKQDAFNTTLTIKNANTPNALSFATEKKERLNLMDSTAVTKAVMLQLAARRVNSINWAGGGSPDSSIFKKNAEAPQMMNTSYKE